MGTSLHSNGRFADANGYYELLLSDSEVDSTLYSQAETYYGLSQAKRTLKTADDLYNESMSASGATGAWNLAQELKELYTTDTRISEAVNKAANRLLVMGTSLHSNGRFADANTYYELLLSDSEVDSTLYSQAETYYGLSQAKRTLKTADDLYSESMSASGATGAWNLAQELKELYPTDTRISEAVNKAANRLLVMGTSLHSNGRFADANTYYELL